MKHKLHTSVYISSKAHDCATVNWCRQVIGTVDALAPKQASRAWSWYRRCVYPKHISTNCCVFDFADSRHKLLFDLAWGHLGIHNTVQSLELQLDRELT
jgi:hypothetical protein